MKKRSVVLIIATILATLYSIYLVNHFYGGVSDASGTELLGGLIASALITPHMAMFAVGAVFGWLGVFMKANWAALVSAILYSVGTALFLAYAMFGIPILVLAFIGYAKQKKINGAVATANAESVEIVQE